MVRKDIRMSSPNTNIQKRRKKEFETLLNLSNKIATQDNPESLLTTIVNSCCNLLSVKSGFIYLYDTLKNELELIYESGNPDYVGIRLQIGEGIAGKVAHSLEPFIVDDYSNWDKRSSKFDNIDIGAVAEVPMQYSGQLIGVLGVQEFKPRKRHFTRRELDLLQILSAHASAALHNAHMLSRYEHEVEKRKDTEKRLKDSLRRFEELINSVEGIVWEADPATLRFTFVSRKAERLLGYPLSEWVSRENFRESHLHPEDRETAVSFLKNAVKRGKDCEFSYRMIHAGGQTVWLREIVNLVKFKSEIQQIRGIIFDITEMKMLEEKIRLREKHFWTLFENAPDAVFLAEPESGAILNANKQAVRLTGYSLDELKKMHQSDLHPKEMYQFAIESFQQHAREPVESRMSTPIRSKVLHKSGKIIDVEVAGNTFIVNGKKYLLGIFRCMAATIEIEKELRHSRADYQRIFENAHDAILIFEPQSEKILEVNQRACEIYGFPQKELLGKSLKSISKDVKTGEKRIKTLLRTKESIHFETVHYRRDGSEMYLEINAALIEYKGRQAILSINRDITGRKKAEEEREKLIGELQQALKQVKTLRGLLPICSNCKRIRDDDGYWQQIEVYIGEHSDAEFTHGLCVDCAKNLYPDMNFDEPAEN